MTTLVALLIWISVPSAATPAPDFARDVRPIFEARCQPCHFAGGKMYGKLPFDKAETITRLGTKLFTRIKDERQRTVIRAYLRSAGVPPAPAGRPGRQ
jgi:hypothetical protein